MKRIFIIKNNKLFYVQVTSTMLAQKHSSVFHAGVIGHGPRKPPPGIAIDRETIVLNKILLIDVIKVPTNSELLLDI